MISRMPMTTLTEIFSPKKSHAAKTPNTYASDESG